MTTSIRAGSSDGDLQINGSDVIVQPFDAGHCD